MRKLIILLLLIIVLTAALASKFYSDLLVSTQEKREEYRIRKENLEHPRIRDTRPKVISVYDVPWEGNNE